MAGGKLYRAPGFLPYRFDLVGTAGTFDDVTASEFFESVDAEASLAWSALPLVAVASVTINAGASLGFTALPLVAVASVTINATGVHAPGALVITAAVVALNPRYLEASLAWHALTPYLAAFVPVPVATVTASLAFNPSVTASVILRPEIRCSMATVYPRSTIRIPAEFRLDDTLFDPTYVRFSIYDRKQPGLNEDHAWPPDGGTIVRSAVGTFYAEYVITTPGAYSYRWESTAPGEVCAIQGSFTVVPT